MAVFTPSVAGAKALYYRVVDGAPDPGLGFVAVPIEAWDDTGAPYVAGGNKLVLATAYRQNKLSFLRLSGAHLWTGFGRIEDTGD